MQYIAIYGHTENCIPGRLTLDARTDAEARAEVDAFVAAGYRNETWCRVALSDGTDHFALNRHGDAKSADTD